MKKMTLMQHFSELRKRVLWTIGVFVVGFVIGLFVAPQIQEFLTQPLLDVWTDGTLLYTELSDGLMIQFSLATLFSLLLTLPMLLWQFWAFVSPGLHKNERGIICPILILSPVLFLVGAAFAFYILFPYVFKFFIDLNNSSPVPTVILPTAKNYLSFVIGLLKVFGLAFQLPLIMVLLNRMGILSRDSVIKFRRYAVIMIFVIAAVLTPPDVVSQLLLGIPLWGLFEISILFMRK